MPCSVNKFTGIEQKFEMLRFSFRFKTCGLTCGNTKPFRKALSGLEKFQGKTGKNRPPRNPWNLLAPNSDGDRKGQNILETRTCLFAYISRKPQSHTAPMVGKHILFHVSTSFRMGTTMSIIPHPPLTFASLTSCVDDIGRYLVDRRSCLNINMPCLHLIVVLGCLFKPKRPAGRSQCSFFFSLSCLFFSFPFLWFSFF